MPVTETKGFGSPKGLNDSVREREVRPFAKGGRGVRNEDYRSRLSFTGEGAKTLSDDLSAQLREILIEGGRVAHLFGVGNAIRQDDALGLEVISSLRRRLRSASQSLVRIHAPSANTEGLISNLASRGARIVVIDALQAQKEPGTVVCARLSETKFGFFATHNVPLRLIPGVADNAANTFVIGIQPDVVGVGEGLSDVVKNASNELVAMIADLVESAE